MRSEDRVRLRHMIDAVETTQRFLSGRTRDDLDRDQMLLFAVVRAIEILGEAAGRLTEEVRAQSADIPWAAIVSMRNRLIHGYFDIDAEIVWKTATEELPELLPGLRTLLAD